MFVTLDEFIKIRKELKEKNKKLVFTNGCFDILHAGHVDYLNKARQFGDAMIVALGNGSNPLLVQTTPGLDADKKGHIIVNETQLTSKAKVWAGGDIVLGAATVILAMGEGRKAVAGINEYLAK